MSVNVKQNGTLTKVANLVATEVENLDMLGDVDINNPQNGQALVYNSTTQKWENGSGGGGNYETVTVAMYGAAGAVITWTNEDGTSGTATMDSSGENASVNIVIDPSGSSITFTDTTVAKDPSNLSNNYTKTITVDENTTDVYIMPDNVLYWWGYAPYTFGSTITMSNLGSGYSNVGVFDSSTNSLTKSQSNQVGTAGGYSYNSMPSKINTGTGKIHLIASQVGHSSGDKVHFEGDLTANTDMYIGFYGMYRKNGSSSYTAIICYYATTAGANGINLNTGISTSGSGTYSQAVYAFWYE